MTFHVAPKLDRASRRALMAACHAAARTFIENGACMPVLRSKDSVIALRKLGGVRPVRVYVPFSSTLTATVLDRWFYSSLLQNVTTVRFGPPDGIDAGYPPCMNVLGARCLADVRHIELFGAEDIFEILNTFPVTAAPRLRTMSVDCLPMDDTSGLWRDVIALLRGARPSFHAVRARSISLASGEDTYAAQEVASTLNSLRVMPRDDDQEGGAASLIVQLLGVDGADGTHASSATSIARAIDGVGRTTCFSHLNNLTVKGPRASTADGKEDAGGFELALDWHRNHRVPWTPMLSRACIEALTDDRRLSCAPQLRRLELSDVRVASPCVSGIDRPVSRLFEALPTLRELHVKVHLEAYPRNDAAAALDSAVPAGALLDHRALIDAIRDSVHAGLRIQEQKNVRIGVVWSFVGSTKWYNRNVDFDSEKGYDFEDEGEDEDDPRPEESAERERYLNNVRAFMSEVDGILSQSPEQHRHHGVSVRHSFPQGVVDVCAGGA